MEIYISPHDYKLQSITENSNFFRVFMEMLFFNISACANINLMVIFLTTKQRGDITDMRERRIFAVIGDPVSHSLSPVMHNAAFRHLGLNAEYAAICVKNEELESFAKHAVSKLDGFNITVPHKNAIIPFLDTISRQAELASSVNTVKIMPEGRLYGDSTDGYGLEMALSESFGFSIPSSSVCFIGCGGVTQALTFHFAMNGVKRIFLLNRTVETAAKLAAKLSSEFPEIKVEYGSVSDRDAAGGFLNSSDLAIQATSLGLKESDPPPVPPELLPRKILFYDTIYKKTALLGYARNAGIKTANGLSMLLHQGAKSFTIWTGLDAPVEVMREALYSEFERRNAGH